jgi:steroid 5-alpha reductase family enzyme
MRLAAALAFVLALAGGLAAAGSWQGASVFGLPVFALCAGAALAIQWLVFLPSFLARTEHFYDLTGSSTYVLLTVAAYLAGPGGPARLLLAAMVLLWALRLGAFLFRRVRQDGGDGRFDRIKHNGPRFFFTWTLQGLWVLVTAGAAWAALGSAAPGGLGPLGLLGAALWLAGFAVETAADAQKRAFRRRAGAGAFIDEGLWRYSRHPNYAGEILLWLGVALASLPLLSGWQLVTLVSPLFVYLLLTRVSGIPLLERRGRERWGDDPAYRGYLERTPVLFPWSRRGPLPGTADRAH